jgi:hypothetical protein
VTAHTITNRTGIFCAAQRRAFGCGRFSRHNRFGWFKRSGFLPLPAFAFRLRHRRLSNPHRWLFASTLLSFQRLPALHFLQTVGVPAVPLIVGRRNIVTVAALSETNSRETSRFPRRARFVVVVVSKRPTNPFLSGSVVWSPVSSGFQISHDEVVHERVGAVVA